MAVCRIPVIYDQVTRQIRPAGVCDIIDPRYSNYDAGRLLYQDQTNALRIIDGQLYCSAVSKDKGNYIKAGKDGSPFLDGNAILSNGGDGLPNLLSIDAVDGKIVLTLDVLTNYGVATKTAIDIAATNIKEYIDSAFVTLESFPTKVAAFTSELVTVQEFDSLRVRVVALERAIKSLTDQLSALGVHVDTEFATTANNITALSNKVTEDIAVAKDEAFSEINTVKTNVTSDLNTLKTNVTNDLNTLTDQLSALDAHVDTEFAKTANNITALSNKVTSDITAAKDEALSEINTVKTNVTSDLNTLKTNVTSEINTVKTNATSDLNTLKADVTDELYNIYDTFPSYTLLTSHNALRASNAIEHEAVGVAGQIAAMSATTVSRARNLSNEYSNDMLSSLSELNALSADIVANTQNAITHLEG